MEEADFLSEEGVVIPFSELTQMFVNQVTDALQAPAEPPVQPRFLFGGYGGCNDAFSVFGFLAFLLALFDLIMELQDDADTDTDTEMPRSVRDVSGREGLASEFLAEHLLPVSAQEPDERSQQTAAACYSILRGFLNSITATDAACAERFLCEGAEAAAATGDFGKVIARVASPNAASWLTREREDQYAGVGEAVLAGARGESCTDKYPKCQEYPPFYSHPGLYDPWPDQY